MPFLHLLTRVSAWPFFDTVMFMVMDEFGLDEFVLDVDAIVPSTEDRLIVVADEFILESLTEGTWVVMLRLLVMLKLGLSSFEGSDMGKDWASAPTPAPSSIWPGSFKDESVAVLADALLLTFADDLDSFVDGSAIGSLSTEDQLVPLLTLIPELSPLSAAGFSMGKYFACTPLSFPKCLPDSVGVNVSEGDKLLALKDVLLLAMEDDPEFIID